MDLAEGEEEEAATLGGDDWRLPISATEGWEPVAPPPPPPPLLPASHEDNVREWEMVAAAATQDDGCSVFPPSDHEGLHVDQSVVATPEGGFMEVGVPTSSSPPPSSSLPSVSSTGDDGEARRPARPLWREGEGRRLVELARRAVRSGCMFLGCTLQGHRVGGRVKPGAGWSLAAVAVMTAALLCIRRRYQREKLRLLLLIQQKDQRISQLLLQIAQMNELLSSRRNVPVLRTF